MFMQIFCKTKGRIRVTGIDADRQIHSDLEGIRIRILKRKPPRDEKPVLQTGHLQPFVLWLLLQLRQAYQKCIPSYKWCILKNVKISYF